MAAQETEQQQTQFRALGESFELGEDELAENVLVGKDVRPSPKETVCKSPFQVARRT